MTDYPRCRTCRHWESEPLQKARGRLFGWCSRFVMDDPDRGALLVLIGEGASVYTTPDFGCIQHEERDDGTTQG